MFDLSKIKYTLVVLDENNKSYNISDYVENLGWEENEKELAVRISFSVQNGKTSAGRLSTIANLGRLVGIFATDEQGKYKEAARGYIVDWRPAVSASKQRFEVKAYDDLFVLQKSQDNLFYPDKTRTRTILEDIFQKWSISLNAYDGPDVVHGKQTFKAKRISDILMEVLADAKKKGGGECIIRAEKGQVSIRKWGSNQTIYCFDADNSMMQEHLRSTDGMITRVKVIGQANDDGKSEVEFTADGKTEFGIYQKIYSKGKEETAEEAKKAANELLEEEGKLKEEITVQAPDIPFIRKGDLVYVKLGTLIGYYFVKGIRHDVEAAKMTMDLKKASDEALEAAVPAAGDEALQAAAPAARDEDLGAAVPAAGDEAYQAAEGDEYHR